MPNKRALLGRQALWFDRSYVYLTDAAFEIDDVDGYEISRRRIFFDDVLMVSLHGERRIGMIIGLACLNFWVGLVFAGIYLGVTQATGRSTVGLWVSLLFFFLIFTLPLLIH